MRTALPLTDLPVHRAIFSSLLVNIAQRRPALLGYRLLICRVGLMPGLDSLYGQKNLFVICSLSRARKFLSGDEKADICWWNTTDIAAGAVTVAFAFRII